MSTRAADYLDAIEHLPAGATLVVHNVNWEDYERLLEDRGGRCCRISYDDGRLQIVTLSPEHEGSARFVDSLVRAYAEHLNVTLENYGSTTWKQRSLLKGAEPDCCYYVANADRIIGKRNHISLESDPPPDVVVEIDITNESLGKFGIYAALGVSEIWRSDGRRVWFFTLNDRGYREISESHMLPGLTPTMLAAALEHSGTEGQTAAVRVFRQQLR